MKNIEQSLGNIEMLDSEFSNFINIKQNSNPYLKDINLVQQEIKDVKSQISSFESKLTGMPDIPLFAVQRRSVQGIINALKEKLNELNNKKDTLLNYVQKGIYKRVPINSVKQNVVSDKVIVEKDVEEKNEQNKIFDKIKETINEDVNAPNNTINGLGKRTLKSYFNTKNILISVAVLSIGLTAYFVFIKK